MWVCLKYLVEFYLNTPLFVVNLVGTAELVATRQMVQIE